MQRRLVGQPREGQPHLPLGEPGVAPHAAAEPDREQLEARGGHEERLADGGEPLRLGEALVVELEQPAGRHPRDRLALAGIVEAGAGREVGGDVPRLDAGGDDRDVDVARDVELGEPVGRAAHRRDAQLHLSPDLLHARQRREPRDGPFVEPPSAQHAGQGELGRHDLDRPRVVREEPVAHEAPHAGAQRHEEHERADAHRHAERREEGALLVAAQVDADQP
ncbi:MAG: hypothetical protein QM765_18955 [Myxococcales bacterium]